MDTRDKTQMCQFNNFNDEPVNKATEKKCQFCVMASANGAKFCPQCGCQLVVQNNTEDVCNQESNSVAEVATNKEVADVPQTQSEQKSSAVTVKPQVISEKPFQCSCGQSLPTGAKFCFQCGKELGKSLLNYRLISRGRGKADVVTKMTSDVLTIGKNDGCDLIIADDALYVTTFIQSSDSVNTKLYKFVSTTSALVKAADTKATEGYSLFSQEKYSEAKSTFEVAQEIYVEANNEEKAVEMQGMIDTCTEYITREESSSPPTTSVGNYSLIIYAIFLLIVTLMITHIYRMSTRIKALEKKEEKTVSSVLTCPVCKHEIEEHWAACPHCGTILKDDTQIY